MKRACHAFAYFAVMGLVVAALPAAAQAPQLQAILSKDVARASDHPLSGRYKDSILLAQTVQAFDEIVLPSGPAEGKTYARDRQRFTSTMHARGKITRSIYLAPPERSSLEVMTNFVETVAGKGFETVFQCAAAACGESFHILKYRWDKPETKVVGANYENLRKHVIDAVFNDLNDVRYTLFKKSGPEGDTIVAIYGGQNRGGAFGNYSDAIRGRVSVLVEIVEPRAMERRMEMVSAAEIGGKVMAEGRAVFYGILFDFDKAEIKPESEPQLAEMAKFLQSNPQVRVYIVGHTDSKGGLDYNIALSARRADAVVQALASRHQVDMKRLSPRGLGPLAPVTSNRSEDGRARNRRVEMVEQ